MSLWPPGFAIGCSLFAHFVTGTSTLTKSLPQQQNAPSELEQIRTAMVKLQKIFAEDQRQKQKDIDIAEELEEDMDEVLNIEHRIKLYNATCPDIELFAVDALEECGSMDAELTDYLREVSETPEPPIHHTIHWYWTQDAIWKKASTEFVCLQSLHFQKVAHCLCQYCSWPFTADNERYDVHSSWKKEYDRRQCARRTKQAFMKTSDDLCKFLKIVPGEKGKKIAARKREELAKSEEEGDEQSESVQANDAATKTNEAMKESEQTRDASAAPISFNSLPMLMTLFTVIVMLISALFFVVVG
eukprot:CAMPEP_0197020850 /NCGR_PEP_ID=MMETSP1384-20130603/1718_1 /TAXON_ID=29189 /ORGANISM="Ammonia sp." /LENGTH=300 /DNA_ID=CAMNT_0042448555 /DNA_START=43 /DNA_END=945 /DNA_ORIENTATION=+